MARNLTSLIVDPNPNSRLDVTRALESIGLDCVGESAYGTEAAFLAVQHRPNLVLLALEDPPVRGLATLEAIQQQLPDTPVLVYSSMMTPLLMRQAMRTGARDFLAKPLAPDELRDAVHSVLAQEEQRQLARWSDQSAVSARGTVITVAGAKGGIGKTTFATNLAVLLRKITGQEVALMDGDAQFGDVGVMLDMAAERSIADLARNEAEIDRSTLARYLVRHECGLDVLLAASEPDDWRAVQPEQMSAMVRALSETHEYVVVDTPGVMNELVAASLNEAAVVMLVTSLDVSSVKDTRTAMRIFESWGFPTERIRLVINDSTRASVVKAEDVTRATGVQHATVIPFDSNVGMAVQTGVPIVLSQPGARAARAMQGVAESISGLQSEGGRSFISLPRLPLMKRRAL